MRYVLVAKKIPHQLSEIAAYLQSQRIRSKYSSWVGLSFILYDNQTIVRYNEKDNEIIILFQSKGLEIKLPCKEFADERIIHFARKCDQLKSVLQMQPETSSRFRTKASGRGMNLSSSVLTPNSRSS